MSEEAKLIQAQDSSLIKRTKFEDLLAQINEESIQSMKATNKVARSVGTIKRIMFIYAYMRHILGMTYRPLTMGEYEVVLEKLNQTADEKIEMWNKYQSDLRSLNWWRKLRLPRPIEPYQYVAWESLRKSGFLDNGHTTISDGRIFMYCSCSMCYATFCSVLSHENNTIDMIKKNNGKHSLFPNSFPPNFPELFREVYKNDFKEEFNPDDL